MDKRQGNVHERNDFAKYLITQNFGGGKCGMPTVKQSWVKNPFRSSIKRSSSNFCF